MMDEDTLFLFGFAAAVAFLVLLTLAIVLAITHWLFGGAGVGLMVGIIVVALFIGYLVTLFAPEDL